MKCVFFTNGKFLNVGPFIRLRLYLTNSVEVTLAPWYELLLRWYQQRISYPLSKARKKGALMHRQLFFRDLTTLDSKQAKVSGITVFSQ